jgi:zinc/manganese transport system permease protein
MFAHEFMRHALIAGSFVGLACGLVGYFVVLRAQVFAGDALSHVAFTGALAAAVLGFDVRIGLFAATITAGILLGVLGERARADDVVIGSLFAWTLGLGVLFLSIFTTNSSAGDGTAGVRVLFGSIFGLSTSDVETAVALATLASILLLVIARPLLYATLDAAVAAAQGVPVRALGLGFLALLGLVAAQAGQAVGALLLLGLLAAPAGAAYKLTTNPYRGLLLSAALAVASVWIGLTLSYLFPRLPPSSMIIGAAVGIYMLALGVAAVRHPRARRLRLARVIGLGACCIAVLGLASIAQAAGPARGAIDRPLAGKVVVIDPGHNPGNAHHAAQIDRAVDFGAGTKPCDTTGTATLDGYSEAAYTLDVASRVRALLRAAGATVILTHTATTPPWGPCITERAAIGNRNHAAAAVSIHADGGPAGGRGFTTIIPASPLPAIGLTGGMINRDRKLAIAVRDSYHAATGVPYSTYLGAHAVYASNAYGGTNLSRVPKIFIETGNMRNRIDAALLESPAFRERAAHGIASGIARFIVGS